MSRRKWWTITGWLGIALFVVIYAAEFLPRDGPPITIRWIGETFGTGTLIALNVVIVLAFLALLPYRRPTKSAWKSHGTFVAFVIALMTEMFGWPLVLLLASPLVEIPSIAPAFFHKFGHWPAMFGTVLSMVGILLIAGGWVQIHRATDIVKTGLYRSIRHPQYTGIFLFTLGWILHWPSIVTLILWPILMLAYIWLARQEEKQAITEFGEEYLEYMKRTKRFVPFLI